MRKNPPKNFDIEQFFAGIYTFQKWEVFPGYWTTGPKDVAKHMRHLHVPDRLDGLRILDIAPWNGFFSFECARRGAAEVISLGPDDPDKTGYNKTRELLELDNCTYVRESVYDLSPEKHGLFDVVLFLGVIYHLRHPLLALDRIHDVAKDRLYTDTPIIDRQVHDKTIGEEQRRAISMGSRPIHQLPMAYFTGANETGDDFNWFMPNKCAFRDFVRSSGFDIDYFHDDGGWASIAAVKTARAFTPGVEGYNAAASGTALNEEHAGIKEQPDPLKKQCPVCASQALEFSTIKVGAEYSYCLSCSSIFSADIGQGVSYGQDEDPSSRAAGNVQKIDLKKVFGMLGREPAKIMDVVYSDGGFAGILVNTANSNVEERAQEPTLGSVDVISLIETIERFQNLAGIIETLLPLLKPDGVFYIHSAFVDFLWNPAESDYIDPRLGRLLIHSQKSIALIADSLSMKSHWMDNNTVILYKLQSARSPVSWSRIFRFFARHKA